MRLLNVHNLEFHEHRPPIPPYVIASHRWKRGTEATFEDVRDKHNTDREGYVKVQEFVDYVKAHVPHVEWLWIDTCCIDQKSSLEVSKAINSMFRWYSQAEVCLAYLADVEETANLDEFKSSVWFTRGWTLQELLAPWTVVFLTREWKVIGHKGRTGRGRSGMELGSGPSIAASIAAISGLPQRVLDNFEQSSTFAIEERLNWMRGRETTEEEDMWYCLLGIFGVSMPVIYGEGVEHAKRRLLEEISKSGRGYEQQSLPTQENAGKAIGTPSNVPFRRDRDFVNRDTLMDLAGQKLALPGGRAALVGLGGAGKSQLAIEYAYRVREQSPEQWVFWIHASNAARFEQGMRDVADLVKVHGRDDPRADILRLVREWLRDGREGPWMVILDSVDDAGFLVERELTSENHRRSTDPRLSLVDYLPVCAHGSILITSRSQSAAMKLVERSDTIVVDPMDKDTAMALLEKKLGKQEDKTYASELLETLEYMPLAITQAAAYIKQRARRCSIRQYLEKLHASNMSIDSILDSDTGDLRRDHDARNSIILTWQISFEHIHQIRPSAADMLSLMSFCDRQAIPEALLRQHAVGKNENPRKKEQGHDRNDPCKSIVDSADCGGVSVGHDRDDELDDAFDKDIMTLEGYSFVSQTTDLSSFDMHRLVQVATRKWLKSKGQLGYWHEQHINNLCALFPPGTYENWPTCQVYYPHVRSLAEMKPEGRNAVLNWASVMYSAASYAKRRLNAAVAGKLAMLSLEARTKLLGEHDKDTLSSQAILALAWASAGRWHEAQELQMQVLEGRQKTLGTEHPDTLTSMTELASTYGQQGQWREAERLQAHVIQRGEETVPTEQPNLLKAKSELVWTYYNQHRLEVAKDLGQYVEREMSKALHETHPDVIVNTAYLGAVYEQLGELRAALACKRKVLDVRKQELGDEHHLTLISMVNLALTYRRQGMLQEAEELEVDALEKRRRTLGPTHHSTLTSMNNLAWTWLNQGYYAKAKKIMNECITASVKQLGRTHEKTIHRIHFAPTFGIKLCVTCFRDLSPPAQSGNTACNACYCSGPVSTRSTENMAGQESSTRGLRSF